MESRKRTHSKVLGNDTVAPVEAKRSREVNFRPTFRRNHVIDLVTNLQRRRNIEASRRLLIGHPSFVKRLVCSSRLQSHEGCVNSVTFNKHGTLLVSGSDDCDVKIWSPRSSTEPITSIATGHHGNIFGANFVPGDESKIVSCAADGEIRIHDVNATRGEPSRLLHSASSFMLKMDFHPEMPSVFCATASDGRVFMIDLRDEKVNVCVDLRKLGATTAIGFDPNGSHTLAVGADDPVLRIFDVRFSVDHGHRVSRQSSGDKNAFVLQQHCPPQLLHNEDVGVSGLQFSKSKHGLVVANYKESDIFCFNTKSYTPTQALGRMDPEYMNLTYEQVYKGRRNKETFAKEVCFFGGDDWVASGCDSGHLFIWSQKTGKVVRRTMADRCVVNCVAAHPSSPLLAVSGIDWDIKMFACGAKHINDRSLTNVVAPAPSALRHSQSRSPTPGSAGNADTDADTDDRSSLENSSDDDDDDEDDLSDGELSFRQRMLHNPPIYSEAEADNALSSSLQIFKDAQKKLEGNEPNVADALTVLSRCLLTVKFCAHSNEVEESRINLEYKALMKQAYCHLQLRSWQDAILSTTSAISLMSNTAFAAYVLRAKAHFERGEVSRARDDLGVANLLRRNDKNNIIAPAVLIEQADVLSRIIESEVAVQENGL
eukprot:m.170442 g.170442  ORF g.170442 m.170442 type:complete len:655 (-) comp31610_c0_seq3:283-2247(-)